MNENLKKQLGNLTEGAMTIPNLLSVIRIILIPVFLVLFLKGSYLAAVIVLGISGLTDTLDGKIARAFNQVSNLGKLLDPIFPRVRRRSAALWQLALLDLCPERSPHAHRRHRPAHS